MKNFNRAVLAVIIASSLIACKDDKKIETVKNLSYENIDSTNTLGNALDTRNMCKETKWESGKDERNREVVDYTCELVGFDIYFSQWNDYYIGMFKDDNSKKLDNSRREVSQLIKSQQDYERYVSFVNTLDKQNVIKVLADVKKQVKVIRDMSNFAGGVDEKRAIEVGVPKELVETFTAMAKLYQHAVYEGEFGEDFAPLFYNSSFHNEFEELLDAVGNGKTVQDVLFDRQAITDTENSLLRDSKKKLNDLEAQLSEEGLNKLRISWEKNQPVKIVQRITYAIKPIDKIGSTAYTTPVLLYCGFDFYTAGSKDAVAYRKVISDGTTCLTESYRSTYSKFYTDMFGKIYIEQKGRK